MRRTFSQVIAGLVVIALVAPAASAAAGQEGQRPAASQSSTVSAAALVRPVPLTTAIARAVTTNQAADQGPVAPRVKARGVRQQGGGKSGMITGLVSAVVGIVGMMYMMKYLKDQQKASETTLARVR